MENGHTCHGCDARRRTVSGPLRLPPLELDPEDANMKKSDNMKLPWSSPSAPSSPAEVPPSPAKQSGHRRTLSGNFLAKFNFLKGVVEDARPPSRDKDSQTPQSSKSPKSARSRKSVDDDDAPESPVSPTKGESAMASALKASKTRKRKGSLRKTALLGTRKLVTETRERRNSVMHRSPSSKHISTPLPPEEPSPPIPNEPEVSGLGLPPALRRDPETANALRTKFSYENVSAASSSDSGWGESAAATSARLALLTDHRVQQKQSTTLSSPLDMKSPVSNSSYASTTDDDEVLTFDRPANSFASSQSLKKPLSSAATSYFPSETSISEPSISRRVSSKHRSSPLSQVATSHSPYTEPEPHDYTETEYWGWVILFVTWLAFTVGMGSCLEIWSWAWDVGETPYAPPELEDDETLPIVGYYPALMVLTGVVAWVWITVAWIGMKYFRHAKIEV